jgi:hypothetical protein
MPRKFEFHILILIGMLIYSNAPAATVPKVASIDPPKSILFVGNSYTFYNDSLHNALRDLIRSANLGDDYPGTIRAVTKAGAKLADHATAIKWAVGMEDWDVVVLQGHSLETMREESRKSQRDHFTR